MKRFVCALLAAALSGCAYQMTLMPRDSGKTYTGILNSDGTGNGSMTLNMDGVSCTGPVARVASNQTFGFANTFGNTSRGTAFSGMSTYMSAGDVFVKAILTCTDGRGVRCDLSGRGTSGGGICMDDTGRVFDALAVHK